MPGITPDEGEALIGRILYRRDLADRAADLRLGLFTNNTVTEATTLSSITEPTGTGYARITLTDANWTVNVDTTTHPQQIFTAGAGGWTPEVQGYFIATQGTTPRLLHIELDTQQIVTSITRSSSTATVTTPQNHGWSNGDRINVRGANQSEYNGTFVISNVTANTFQYTVTGTPATPATGTISVNRCYLMNANDTYSVDLSNVVA